MLVAVHQPNFFPWLGYFDKIAQCDQFVLLDNVQLPKTGGSWLNHVQLLVGGEPRWMTAPVRKGPGVQAIEEARFGDGPWRRKALGMLQAAYGRAPHFSETIALIEPLLANTEERLADYNTHAIQVLDSALGLGGSKIVRSSALAVDGSATDLLIGTTRALGGDCYLAGGGARAYQEDYKFADAGMGLRYQAFAHPEYPQHGNRGAFVPGLSVIDALMNLGIDGTTELLRRDDT